MNTTRQGPAPKVAVLALLALWPVCLGVAVAGFWAQWRQLPEIGELIIGNTLMLPFALPKAFGDVICITARNSASGVPKMMAIFWPVTLGLILAFLRSRFRWIAYAALATMLLLASWQWLIVSVGMMGL